MNCKSKRTVLVLAFLSVLFFAPLTATAIVVHDGADPAECKELAQSFPAVGCLALRGEMYGSATLIAPDKVLTAAHLLDVNLDYRLDRRERAAVLRMTFEVGYDRSSPAQIVSVVSAVIHPGWRRAGRNAHGRVHPDAFDIAVLTLTEPVVGVKPMQIADLRPLGKTVEIVGYGLVGNGNIMKVEKTPLRTAGRNVIDVLEPEKLMMASDFDEQGDDRNNHYGSEVPVELEASTAPGDSGGCVSIRNGEGVSVLVGVISGGYRPVRSLDDDGEDGEYQVLFGHINFFAPLYLASTREFLKQAIADAADSDSEPESEPDSHSHSGSDSHTHPDSDK